MSLSFLDKINIHSFPNFYSKPILPSRGGCGMHGWRKDINIFRLRLCNCIFLSSHLVFHSLLCPFFFFLLSKKGICSRKMDLFPSPGLSPNRFFFFFCMCFLFSEDSLTGTTDISAGNSDIERLAECITDKNCS